MFQTSGARSLSQFRQTSALDSGHFKVNTGKVSIARISVLKESAFGPDCVKTNSSELISLKTRTRVQLQPTNVLLNVKQGTLIKTFLFAQSFHTVWTNSGHQGSQEHHC